MVRKTRKAPSTKGKEVQKEGMTIPELRKAFEHIDAFVHGKVSKLEEDQAIASFRKEWKKVFGKDVSERSAKEYLNFVMSEKRNALGHGSQKGGAAPLGWDMTPGTGTPLVPPYVASGFGFANNDSIVAECGKVDITPQLLPGMGSNLVKAGGGKKKVRKTRKQKGGSLTSAAIEMITRPFMPTGFAHSAMMISKGDNSLSSPRPEIPSFTITQPTTVYSATATPASRTF